MSLRRGARLAGAVFVLTWVPLSLWRGLAFGRTFRIGRESDTSWGPLVEGVIQVSAVMIAPALLAALAAFVLWAWRDERRSRQRPMR
jgi:hypothetical protein